MIDPFAAAPNEMKAWVGAAVAAFADLDPVLAHLIQTRASQINGCANCLNLHTASARARGETEQRLHLLAGWRDAPCYSDRERAALAWTDALTRLSDGADLASARDALQAHFTAKEQVQITIAINVVNGFNRLSRGLGLWTEPAGTAAPVAA